MEQAEIETMHKKTADDPILNSEDMDEYLSQISERNIDNFIDTLGLQKCAQGYRFDFFNRPILFDSNDFIDLSGKAMPPAIKTVFCRYLIMHPENKTDSSGKLVTFREFSGAGPLFSRFVENTNKTIEKTFSGRLETLEKKCQALFGMPLHHSAYDLSIRFKALPKIPVTLQFNDADDIFPATSVFLFHDDAITYLDLKSLASIVTWFTGFLINTPLIDRSMMDITAGQVPTYQEQTTKQSC